MLGLCMFRNKKRKSSSERKCWVCQRTGEQVRDAVIGMTGVTIPPGAEMICDIPVRIRIEESSNPGTEVPICWICEDTMLSLVKKTKKN